MRKDLDEKLVKSYPLLYADRHGDMTKTCMAWGFPRTGWYKLINNLSRKLELLIKQWIGGNPNARCMCGEKKELHENENGKCIKIYKLPYQIKSGVFWSYPVAYRRKPKWIWRRFCKRVNRLLYRLCEWKIIYYNKPSECEKFMVNHPRAAQVKQKFGTLRFYMTSGTDEMYKLINEAEHKSARTCEECGLPGKLRTTGWRVVNCDSCYARRNEIRSEK